MRRLFPLTAPFFPARSNGDYLGHGWRRWYCGQRLLWPWLAAVGAASAANGGMPTLAARGWFGAVAADGDAGILSGWCRDACLRPTLAARQGLQHLADIVAGAVQLSQQW